MEVWDEWFPNRTWHLNNGQENDIGSGGVKDGSASGSSAEGRGGAEGGGGEEGGCSAESSGIAERRTSECCSLGLDHEPLQLVL